MSVSRRSVLIASAATVAMLSLALAVACTLSSSVRTNVRWAVRSQHYKREVDALPLPADGYLKHVEWDGWGFPGAGNTVVYLVHDPSNGLAAAAASKTSGRFVGLPRDVYRVRQLERNWYTVHFYTETTWEESPYPGRSRH